MSTHVRVLFGMLPSLAFAVAPVSANDRTPLTDRETAALVEQVTAQQMRFADVAGEFNLTIEGRPPQYVPDLGELLSPDIALRNASGALGPVRGTVLWAKLGTREHLAVRFDLPTSQRVQQYHERDLYLDGDLHTLVYLPSQQVVISRHNSLTHWPQPLDFFFPQRRSVGALIADGAKASAFREKDATLLVIAMPSTPPGQELEARVDPDRGYVITSWRDPAQNLSSDIEWTPGAKGEFVPSTAVLVGRSATPVRTWTMRTSSIGFGATSEPDVTFRLRPGMLVGDYSEYPLAHTGPMKARVYEVNRAGEPVEVVAIEPPLPATAAQTAGVTAASGLATILLLGIRMTLTQS